MSDILLHHSAISTTYHLNINLEKGAGGGSHFHDCIDFYSVVFSAIFNRVTRMGLHICEILGERKLWQVRIHKQEDS